MFDKVFLTHLREWINALYLTESHSLRNLYEQLNKMHNEQTLNLVDSGKQKANFILFEILYASSIYNANDSFFLKNQ